MYEILFDCVDHHKLWKILHVNYVAALLSHAAGDDASARSFIDTAQANADGELLENIGRLAGQIGG